MATSPDIPRADALSTGYAQAPWIASSVERQAMAMALSSVLIFSSFASITTRSASVLRWPSAVGSFRRCHEDDGGQHRLPATQPGPSWAFRGQYDRQLGLPVEPLLAGHTLSHQVRR